MNKTGYILVLCVISVFAVLIYNSQLEKKPEPSRYINPSYELQETMPPLPPLTTEEKEAIRIKSNYSNIIAIGKIVDASKGTKRFPHAAIKIETVIKLDPESAVNKTQVLDKYIRLNKKPQTGVNYYRFADKMDQYYLIFGHIEKSIKDPYTKNNLRIITSSESMVATQEGLNNAQADIVFLGKIKVMPSHWSIPNHYQYQLRAFSIHNILHGFVTGKELHVRYTMPSQGSEHSALTLNTYNRDQYYWIQANKLLGTKQYYAKAIGADLTREIAFLKQLQTEVSNNSLSNTETLFRLAENNQKPYDLNTGYQHIELLTDEEKRRLAKLYNSEHIDIIAVVRSLDVKPIDKQVAPVVIVEEVLKLGVGSKWVESQIIGKPIYRMSMPHGRPHYAAVKENAGKYFLIYANIDELLKKATHTKNKIRIIPTFEYMLATQEEIDATQEDLVFLGEASKDKKDWSVSPDWQYGEVSFFVYQQLRGKGEEKVVVRYPYSNESGNKYTFNIKDVYYKEKKYWISANEIEGTGHYNAKMIGADLTREIAYLRWLKASQQTSNK